ncbi:MAG: hypothetical protein ACPGVU_06085 [Limisphaerales bacterium]
MTKTFPTQEIGVYLHNARAQFITIAVGILWAIAVGIVMPMRGHPPEFMYWPGQIWLGSMFPLVIGSLAMFLTHLFFLITPGNWSEQGLRWKRIVLCLAWPSLAALGGVALIAFMERAIG